MIKKKITYRSIYSEIKSSAAMILTILTLDIYFNLKTINILNI